MSPLLLLAAAIVSGGQDVPRFRSEVRRVFVDAFVTRDGRPVVGLAKEDFELEDDGVPQEIELARRDTVSLSALLVLDTSGSLDERERRLLSEAARRFVAGLAPEDEVGLLTATHRLARRVPLTRDHAALATALEAAMPRGATSMRDAVFAGLTLLEGGAGRPLLIVLTDGSDNTSWLSEDALLDAARASESLLFAIAPASSARVDARSFAAATFRNGEAPPRPRDGRPFFRHLAAETGGELLSVARPEEVAAAFADILAQMRTRYLLVYEPRGVSSSGWHELRVRLRRRRGEVRARPGYRAGP